MNGARWRRKAGSMRRGHELWGQKIGGAVGGGVITYKAGDAQRVAAATGLTEVLWPTEITTAKVSILGLSAAPETGR